MEELIKKLTSYNLFNNLFPGILFVGLAKVLWDLSFIQDNILIGIFYYYFIGMIISRIGSLIIEPILKRIKIITFLEYKRFVFASKKDEKIEILSETNNMIRTIVALLFSLGIIKLLYFMKERMDLSSTLSNTISLIFLVLLFIFSYRKQSEYINKRIVVSEEK